MKTIHLLIGCLAILALSCNKHEVVPPPAPDGDALMAFHKNNVTDAEQHFVVNANAPISIVGEKGTILTLGANKLVDSDGNLVMGNVDVTLIEITKKSEMALLNKGTNGKKLDGTRAPLVSGGEFYVSISQYGSEVTLTAPIEVKANPAFYTTNMRKFINSAPDGEDLLWEMAADSVVILEEDSLGEYMIFEIMPDEWGWLNCDYFYGDPRPLTPITLSFEDGYTLDNTSTFISIDGELVMLNYNLGVTLPVGLEVHFLTVAIIDDELYYSTQGATIVADHNQEIDDFTVTTEDGLMDIIDALP